MSDLITQLCQLTAETLQEHPQADMARLVELVKQGIDANSQLGQAIQSDRLLTQVNRDGSNGFQTWVAGGVANIGNTYLNDVKPEMLQEVLDRVLGDILKSQFKQTALENLNAGGNINATISQKIHHEPNKLAEQLGFVAQDNSHVIIGALNVNYPQNNNRSEKVKLLNVLTIAALTVSLSLVVNTSLRILSNGVNSENTLYVVGQSVLTLMVSAGVLTKEGQKSIEKMLIQLNIPKEFWQEISCGLSLLLMCSLFGVNYSLPNWAIAVNRSGLENYNNKFIDRAKADFERAIAMRPDYSEARYNLGWLYEELNDLDKAKVQYELVVQGDPKKFDNGVNRLKALNNLGRIYILKKEYGTAVRFLSQGIQESESTKSMTSRENSSEGGVYYSLRKNMGWARLMQERYVEAEVQLRSAIALAPKRSPAYCLLAQVVEAKEPNNQAIALEFWKKCISYATPRDFSQSEGDDWYGLANKRLDKAFSNKDTSKDK